MTKLPYVHSYDIRGIAHENLSTQDIKNIAKAIIVEFRPKTIVVGYDMRESSSSFSSAFTQECNKFGVNIVDIGLASTPQLYFATCAVQCDFGVIITASHNPAKYNGMKLCFNNAIPIAYGTGLEKVEEAIITDKIGSLQEVSSEQRGSVTQKNIQTQYAQKVLGHLTKINDQERESPLKIVVDYANAIGVHSNKPILEQLEKDGFIECIHLFDTLDGTFPNHEANPIKEENLVELKKLVVEKGYDLGVCFDGDSDRVGFVDEQGNYIAPDVMGCVLVDHLNRHDYEFKSFCYDLRSTRKLVQLGDDFNKEHYMTRVGHSHIKKKMHEVDAQFACELSGHFYFQESTSKYDDAIRALIEVICALSYYSKPLSQIASEFIPQLKSSEMNFLVQDSDEEMQRSENWVRSLLDDNIKLEVSTLDGMLFECDEFWINIRKSNTEPLLRVNFEVVNGDEALFNQIHAVVEKELK